MKKKLLTILMAICLCVLPQVAWAAADGGDVTNTGLDFPSVYPGEETTYTAGNGTITFTPATDEANLKLTLNNAEIRTRGVNKVAIGLCNAINNNAEDIVLIGANSLDATGGIIQQSGGNHPLTISGTATSSLSIYSQSATAFVHSSNTTFKGGNYSFNTNWNETVTITGNLNIEDNADVKIYNNSKWQSLKVSGKLTVDNSKLYVEKTNNANQAATDISGEIELKSGAEMTVKSSKQLGVNKLTINGGSKFALEAGTSMTANQPITIDSNSQLVVPVGSTLTLGSNAAITNNGTIINNGTIDISNLNFSNDASNDDLHEQSAFIAGLKLSGCGTVVWYDTEFADTYYFTNAGVYMNYEKDDLDLTNTNIRHPEDNVSYLGYTWDKDTNTLTLKNIKIGTLTLPNENVTIIVDGTAVVNHIETDMKSDGLLTIKGKNEGCKDTLYGNGAINFDDGGLLIENLQMDYAYFYKGGNAAPFTIKDSKVTVHAGMYYYDQADENHCLTLNNSQLTVKSGSYVAYDTDTGSSSVSPGYYLWAGRIVMDDSSTLTLDGAPIMNYGNCSTGLDGLKSYLPSGYSIGKHLSGYDDDGNPQYDEAITILTPAPEKDYATNVTLKKQSGSSPSGSSHRYTITASADKGGSISPSGNVRVGKGNDKTFTITADDGYTIADVLVDGESVGAVSSYTFENVRTGHTIKAEFTADEQAPSTTPDGLNSTDHMAYVAGYADGTIQPNANITRAETATMLYRLLTEKRLGEIKTTEHSFTDIPTGAWYTEAVATMSNGGYIKGYADGTFRGNDNITRAEFVTMLVRFIALQDVDCSFTDVAKTHWAYGYIATATQAGWLTGYEDGSFRPDNTITRAEAIAIINRALSRGVGADGVLTGIKTFPDNQTGDWYYYDVVEATNGHDYTGKRPAESWTKLK